MAGFLQCCAAPRRRSFVRFECNERRAGPVKRSTIDRYRSLRSSGSAPAERRSWPSFRANSIPPFLSKETRRAIFPFSLHANPRRASLVDVRAISSRFFQPVSRFQRRGLSRSSSNNSMGILIPELGANASNTNIRYLRGTSIGTIY